MATPARGSTAGGDARAGWARAATWAGLVFVLSYVAQRLGAAAFETPTPGAVAVVHIPFFWRVGVAALHAACAACVAPFVPPRLDAALPALAVVLPVLAIAASLAVP